MAFPPSKSKTYIAGETLTAADLNTSLSDAVNSNIPEDTDDYSANATEMQATADPYPASSESLATSLDGELQRLRYQILQIGKLIGRSTGFTQWYFDLPDTTAATTILDIDNTATDGDPGIGFSLSGTRNYTLGVDDGDGDALKLGTTALGTATFVEFDAGNSQTVFNPDQGNIDLLFRGQNNLNLLVLDASADEVGIGTGTPDGILHLDNGTSNTDLILEKDDGTRARIVFHVAGVEKARLDYDDNEDLQIVNDNANSDIAFIGNNGAALSMMTLDMSIPSVHIRPTGTPDVELEVSNGSSTGGGTIHRASSATHSSIKIKSDIKYATQKDEEQAYKDVLQLPHLKQFRYKKKTVNGKLKRDLSNPLLKGLAYEYSPKSIRDDKTKTVIVDNRIYNLELAMKKLIREMEGIKNGGN